MKNAWMANKTAGSFPVHPIDPVISMVALIDALIDLARLPILKIWRCSRWHKTRAQAPYCQLLIWKLICAAAVLATDVSAETTHLSFLDPQGPIAAVQRTHFIEVLTLLAIFVALPIFVLIPLIAWRYRYGVKGPKYHPKRRASKFFEIAVWGGPIVIVAMLAALVWRSTAQLDPYRPIPSSQVPLRVQVIGYDWKWLFIYPDQQVASIGVLPLPTGRPVSFELTSATVMQSFHIPALGSQIYAMGGMVTRLNLMADTAGRYFGENTMFNGDGFHEQRFTAVGMEPDAFEAWIERTKALGGPLDNATLYLVAKRSTLKELQTALGTHTPQGGGLYFKSVTPELFHEVVMQTMGVDRRRAPPPDGGNKQRNQH